MEILNRIVFGFIVFVFLLQPAFAQNTSDWKIKEVVDGDTIKIEIPAMLPLKYSIRILGIDTPEKKGKCEEEIELSKKATKATKDLFKNYKVINFTNIKHDKFGGRLLADVEVDGINVGNYLLTKGLAREYYGKKKSNWCD
jgi:micrococcal nuclease